MIGGLDEAEKRIAEAGFREGPAPLDLSRLGLTTVPPSVRNVIGRLASLNLSHNPLTELPRWISEGRYLQTLSLNGTAIRTLPEELADLRISTLGMSAMGLVELPPVVRRLGTLTHLSLAGNALTALPDWFGELGNLWLLGLRGNGLSSLPPSMLRLRRLSSLDVGDNPLGLPVEIAASTDPRTILDYYFRTAVSGGSRPLNEFKLVLVGRGGVGKTSLVHRLTTGQYEEFEQTPGVNITQWSVRIENDGVRAHVWDFGGQEIMHGTHRFFMTERALYLVVISAREGTEDHDAEYWLSMVRSFAGEVPIIVLLHKTSECRFQLNTELLRRKYGRALVLLQTDSRTGEGIEALSEAICRLATELPGLRAAWPSEWWRVKNELPEQKRNWLTFHDFRRFVRERGVEDARDQELLADSLNALGLMLSYTRDETLSRFGILNPQWVTQGIYRMLTAPSLRAAGGEFTVGSFAEILSNDDYPPELHPYLLKLMQKFQLCHPLDETGEKYLIPELLTKEEPAVLDREFPPEKSLGFVYRYDAVLPEGLLPRFIVSTYVHRRPGSAWRTGVVLERSNCCAVVRGDVEGRTVGIRVVGTGNRRELLGIIREHFERIHSTYQKLPVTEWVPVPGHPQTLVNHDDLLQYEREGRLLITVKVDDHFEERQVKSLLDGVDVAGTPRVRERESATERLAIPLFISYAHKDAVYVDELVAALMPHVRKRELRVWADSRLIAGESWQEEIFSRIDEAEIIVLLVSNDFLKSEYAIDKELARARERNAVIVPVIIRATRFEKIFGDLQAILPGGKPVGEHRHRDAAWLEVTRQIDKVIAKVRGELDADATRPTPD